MTNTELWRAVVELMTESQLCEYENDWAPKRVAELSAEIDAVIPGAVERLASFVTGSHMTGTESVVWSAVAWTQCQEIMRGTSE